MKQWRGLYLPDREEHLVEWMTKANLLIDGKPSYQFKKLQAALSWVRDWDCAIDVGGHIGTWSMHLTKRFDTVIAFEPIAEHRACFQKNLAGVEGGGMVHLLPFACGAKEGLVALRSDKIGSSGDTHIVEGAGATAELRTIDTIVGDKDRVGFIKLDCEGYELFALHGAEQMLRRCRPVVCVEQKPGKAQAYGLPETGAVDWLIEMGARLRLELSGDFIMSWDEQE